MEFTVSPSKRLRLLLTLLLAGLACRSETERLFAEAERAEETGDFEGAARRLREIVIGHPEGPLVATAKFELAQIHLLRTRDVAAAHGALLEILDDYPDSLVARKTHRLLARLYERDLDDPQRALPHYRAVLQNEADVGLERDTLLSLGECHYRLEQMEEAAAVYRKAAALPYDASSDAAYFRLSTIARLSGDHEAALRWLEQIESRTTDPARRYTALLGQVEAFMSLERFDDARDRLAEAVRLSPDAPQNDELQPKLDSAEGDPLSVDGTSDSPEELEGRIHWGSGRAPRTTR